MIYFIDLVGNSDQDGNPIGHPIKVIRQFSTLFDGYTIKKILPSNYRSLISAHYYFDYKTRLMKSDLISKFYNAFFKLFNYYKVLKKYKGNLFFINTDIYLLMAMSIIKRDEGSKIFAVVYADYKKSASFLKTWFVKKAFKNIDYVITNEFAAQSIGGENVIILPDYFYIEEQYNKKNVQNKYDFLILGIISDSKNIENVIEAVYRKKGTYTLKVCGHFPDKERYNVLIDKYKNSDFISIEDKYIDEDRYSELFSKCKYLVLPYDASRYCDRSSGVFLDSLYFKTPIIATRINIFKAIEEKGMGILYNNSFDECFESLEGIHYSEFIKNIVNFCMDHQVDKYKKVFESLLC